MIDEVHTSFSSPPYDASGGYLLLRFAERAVEVLFPNKKLMRLFSDQTALQKRWGAVGAKRISLRLQQLASVPSLADMRDLPGRCHELSGDRAGFLAVDVHQPYRLILKPSADPPPTKDDGGLDWDAVDSVTVTEIVDYH